MFVVQYLDCSIGLAAPIPQINLGVDSLLGEGHSLTLQYEGFRCWDGFKLKGGGMKDSDLTGDSSLARAF
ncbi:hypothetical protein Lal_00024389 [Lupinus albus]|nr:hypothetical protein Lal_00024389 [Lupinus albus]